jgi:phospholipase C
MRCAGRQISTCADVNGCGTWQRGVDCAPGMECIGEACAVRCNATTCPGCCDGNVCKQRDRLANVCGPNGGACLSCAAGTFCDTSTGACSPSPIAHVVLIVQENHSFDAYFGRYCTAASGSSPACTTGRACCEAAPAQEPRGASPGVLDDSSNFSSDRDHEQACEVQQINGGLMNQYVMGANGSMSCLGAGPGCSNPGNWELATQATVGAYWSLADQNALADRYFQPVAGGSASNDQYFAGAHFRFIDNSALPTVRVGESGSGVCDVPICLGGSNVAPFANPTVADLLLDAGFTFGIYADGYAAAFSASLTMQCASPGNATDCPYRDCLTHPEACFGCLYDPSDIPFLYYAGFTDDAGTPSRYEKDLAALHSDLVRDTLPNFAFVKLRLFHNEHPNVSTISDGMNAVNNILQEIAQSSSSTSTLVLLTWDEGGGFFDHIAPPDAPPVTFDSDMSGGPVPYGTRVPLLAIGPFARAGQVSHVTLEHSSIVRFVEYNFLGHEGGLGARDETVNDLGSLLDLSGTGFDVPSCNPSCAGRACGVSGCGTLCGSCDAGAGCSAGQCVTCGSAGYGACADAGELYCGAGCCPPSQPYFCASNRTCHATADSAALACAGACAVCGPSCTSAVPSGSCMSGQVNCGSGRCCPLTTPYFCPSSQQCFATAEAAITAACDGGCTFCR